MAETDTAYIGVKPCGCVTAAMVAGYGTKRKEKAELKRWMTSGRRVEVTTVAEARTRANFLGECPHPSAPHDKLSIDEEADRLTKLARLPKRRRPMPKTPEHPVVPDEAVEAGHMSLLGYAEPRALVCGDPDRPGGLDEQGAARDCLQAAAPILYADWEKQANVLSKAEARMLTMGAATLLEKRALGAVIDRLADWSQSP